jgi:hypothetical protein
MIAAKTNYETIWLFKYLKYERIAFQLEDGTAVQDISTLTE